MSCKNQFKPPFLHIDSSEFKQLMFQYGHKVTYPANTTILDSGDPIKNIYFIDKGRARYLKISSEGMERVLMILEEGAIFGIAPLFKEGNVTWTSVVTETDTVIYRIDHKTSLQLFDSSKIFRTAIAKALSNSLTTLMLFMESLAFDPCKQRLYNLFCASIDEDSLTGDGWYKLTHQYTQYDMAKIIGATRVTVTKLIKQLCNENLIRIVNNHIEVKYQEE